MKKKEKNAFLINLEYYPAVFFITIARMLPLRVAYCLGEFFFRMVYIFDFKHRRRAIQHALHSGIVETKSEAVKLIKKNYSHFGKMAENIEKHVRPDLSQEDQDEFFTRNQSVPAIVVTGHFGNWEMAGKTYTHFSGIPLTSIMRRLSNPKLGDFIYTNRQGQLHETVSKDKGIRPLLAALKSGGSVAIVADQHASTSEGVETTFFGHPARSHATPALLHLKTKVPIIVGGLRRVDDNLNFEFIVDKVIKYEATGDKEKDIQEITQQYTSSLERMIREVPEQWLWAHRRWLDINRKKENINK
jgi:KDO2-lipid IV(A) lauroyltransferase